MAVVGFYIYFLLLPMLNIFDLQQATQQVLALYLVYNVIPHHSGTFVILARLNYFSYFLSMVITRHGNFRRHPKRHPGFQIYCSLPPCG